MTLDSDVATDAIWRVGGDGAGEGVWAGGESRETERGTFPVGCRRGTVPATRTAPSDVSGGTGGALHHRLQKHRAAVGV